MKRIITLLLSVICLMTVAACGNKPAEAPESSASGSASDLTSISTPYADLKVTSFFYENTTNRVTSEKPYVLTFFSKSGTELFSVQFDKKGDFLLGTLSSDSGEIPVYAALPKLDSKSADYDTNCILQEEVNVISENLSADYKFSKEKANDDRVDTYDISTPIGDVKYPSMWKDKVQTEKKDDEVRFSNNGTPLFDLVFKECDGYLLGKYKDTPVYIVYHDVKTDEQNAMVEDVNVILKDLMKNKDFEVHYGQ